MKMQDRRSGNERRSSNRFPVEVDIEWETAGGRLSGTISDVSLDGCFVLGPGEVNDGDAVKLFVPLADGMKVQFDGTIANSVFEIGFGVRFSPLNAAQRDVLMQLVKQSGG
jgi:hypothetical protein